MPNGWAHPLHTELHNFPRSLEMLVIHEKQQKRRLKIKLTPVKFIFKTQYNGDQL